MKKKRTILTAAGVSSLVTLIAPPSTAFAATPKDTATMDFRTTTVKGKDVGGARIIVVAADGTIIKTGLTNRAGNWRVTLPTHRDLRFKGIRDMGVVTAIAIAHGYNEKVVFEVPVQKHGVEPITLIPVQSNQRNEPTMTVGNIHRHDLAKLVNSYASKLGLERQSPIPGEADYAPWSPELKTSGKTFGTQNNERGAAR